MKKYYLFLLIVIASSCKSKERNDQPAHQYKTTGHIERIDSALDSIISKDALPEIIAEGFDWTEGPVWIERYNMLLFSDVPRDTIFKWTEEKGTEVYLTPSGYTDSIPRGGEMGSNGLTTDKTGNLILCQCGNRQIARMDAPLDKATAKYISLANAYNSKKFNSPNDVVVTSKEEIYFTDPPYGLEKHMEDPKKELPFQGVFRVMKDGKVLLITDSLTRPNGIAFFPNGNTFIVSNSDPEKPNWYLFTDSTTPPHIFYSAAGYDKKSKGLPDGLKIDKKGNVFATGPGGVWIFNSDAKLLGKIKLEEASSNIAFSADEKTIYITNDMYVLRFRMRN